MAAGIDAAHVRSGSFGLSTGVWWLLRSGAAARLEGGPGPGQPLATDAARALVEPPVGLRIEQDELVGSVGLVRLRHAPSIERGCDN